MCCHHITTSPSNNEPQSEVCLYILYFLSTNYYLGYVLYGGNHGNDNATTTTNSRDDEVEWDQNTDMY